MPVNFQVELLSKQNVESGLPAGEEFSGPRAGAVSTAGLAEVTHRGSGNLTEEEGLQTPAKPFAPMLDGDVKDGQPVPARRWSASSTRTAASWEALGSGSASLSAATFSIFPHHPRSGMVCLRS